jgi:N-acetylmuramoyl-L-alanine amidase
VRDELRLGATSLRALKAVGVAAVALVACTSEPRAPAPTDAGPTDADRASALLSPSARLPARAEVVALADALAVASSKAGRTPEGARLARLAADLRARAFRLDQAAADAREALELYAASAQAARGTEEGCEADRRRAMLAGELARDAAVTYRELHLASRRQAAALGDAAHGEGARAACLAEIERALARAVAYRPSIVAMRALEREETDGVTRAASASGGTAAPSTSAGAEPTVAIPPGAAAPREAPTDVVVSPKEDAVGKGPVKVLSIERFGAEKGARVVVNLSAPTTFQVGTLGADEAKGKDARVFVDLARATARGVAREIEVGGAVRRVRIGAHEGGTRVVLDLAAALYRRVFYLPDPFRVVIDVSTRPPVRDEAPGRSGQRAVARVAIDAGHGGVDDGAVGPTGLREKDVTLDIAHRVAPLLAHELKVETLLTRDSDTYVPLELRTARANAFHADFFVSIHCNASENGQARGVQTFVFDASRDPEGFEARVAARENAFRGKASSLDARALDAQMASLFTNLGGSDMAAKSRHVAELLHRSALSSLAPRYPDTKDQGIKTAGFYVLVGADMPAVLFETSFISNPEDESRLATADYRQKLADAIANAIRAYRDGK